MTQIDKSEKRFYHLISPFKEIPLCASIQDFAYLSETHMFQSIDEPNMDLKTFDNLKFI